MLIIASGNTYQEAAYPVSSEPSIFEKKQNGREVIRLTVEGKYSAVVNDFTDGAQITLVDTDDGNGTIEYDKSEFSIAGDIVDHRDGRITVYMGKPTAEEKEKAHSAELEQAVKNWKAAAETAEQQLKAIRTEASKDEKLKGIVDKIVEAK